MPGSREVYVITSAQLILEAGCALMKVSDYVVGTAIRNQQRTVLALTPRNLDFFGRRHSFPTLLYPSARRYNAAFRDNN
ncbi:MAG: hypothetical protein WBW78_18715, partial [Terrimicrobiaceae bacterium]